MINILYIIACRFVLSNTVTIYFPRLLVAAKTLSRSALHPRTKCTLPENVWTVNVIAFDRLTYIFLKSQKRKNLFEYILIFIYNESVTVQNIIGRNYRIKSKYSSKRFLFK